MMVILGGMGTLAGAVLGAFALDACSRLRSRPGRRATGSCCWASSSSSPCCCCRGLAGLGAAASRAAPGGGGGAMTEPVARAPRGSSRALRRPGGGRRRVARLRGGRDPRGDRPNGAGKTTLINLLSGDLAPSGGAHRATRGGTSPGWPPDRIARRGIGRSYQQTNIFLGFTVFENCRLAAQSRLPQLDALLPPRRERYRGAQRGGRARARAAGLGGRGDARRRHAVARRAAPARDRDDPGHRAAACCCSTSRSPAWGRRRPRAWWRCSRALKADHAMLLVEHDMDAVFAVADASR